ncbi:NAD(P)H-hydrate dehydratase [Limihaloglobus sulfuriphilus]|nr:NAD(P)H-hydrate dehydratase [Limihaloglobus sulfuriphilus]
MSLMIQVENIQKLPARADEAYKNQFGRVLIVGGSVGMSGAAVLAGRAALRSGAGLVNLAVPERVYIPVAASEPCYMVSPMSSTPDGKFDRSSLAEIVSMARKADVTALGPGIGVSDDVRVVVANLIAEKGLRLLLDADGLNCLCRIYNWHKLLKCELILTPHPGEMKRLWKSQFREAMPDDRLETVSKFVSHVNTTDMGTCSVHEFPEHANSVLVLKGHKTIVAGREKYFINNTGNPGMSTGGSGDVLTGMTAALWAQFSQAGSKDAAFNAAALAVNLHGKAGDLAAENMGQVSMTPVDMINHLSEVFK